MGFSLPQLNSSCCGCTLRTGTLIILWIYLVFSILALVIPPLAPQPSPATNTTTVSTGTQNSTTSSTKYPVIPSLTVGDVVIGIINIVVGSLGLYGVYKDLHVYLVPFLVWEAVFAIQQAVRAILADFGISTLLLELVALLIFFYFWLVVYSHYRVLKGSARPIQA